MEKNSQAHHCLRQLQRLNKNDSRADKLTSACLWLLRASMPGQKVHQVSVCCWSTRGQPNNDELLWVTQKLPIMKTLLPNLTDSPCWDCCSGCAGAPFHPYRLIPADLWSSKKCLLQLMQPLQLQKERDRSKGDFQTDTCSFYKANQIPCTVLWHRENLACCCWISHRLLTWYHVFFFTAGSAPRYRTICLPW